MRGISGVKLCDVLCLKTMRILLCFISVYPNLNIKQITRMFLIFFKPERQNILKLD